MFRRQRVMFPANRVGLKDYKVEQENSYSKTNNCSKHEILEDIEKVINMGDRKEELNKINSKISFFTNSELAK